MDLACVMHEWSLAMGQPAFVLGFFVNKALFNLGLARDRL